MGEALMAKKNKPISSFEELHTEMAKQGFLKGRGITVSRGGSIHEVDKEDTDQLELGGRVASEWD